MSQQRGASASGRERRNRGISIAGGIGIGAAAVVLIVIFVVPLFAGVSQRAVIGPRIVQVSGQSWFNYEYATPYVNPVLGNRIGTGVYIPALSFTMSGTIMFFPFIVNEGNLSKFLGSPLYAINGSSVIFKITDVASAQSGYTGYGIIEKITGTWYIAADGFQGFAKIDQMMPALLHGALSNP